MNTYTYFKFKSTLAKNSKYGCRNEFKSNCWFEVRKRLAFTTRTLLYSPTLKYLIHHFKLANFSMLTHTHTHIHTQFIIKQKVLSQRIFLYILKDFLCTLATFFSSTTALSSFHLMSHYLHSGWGSNT